MPMTPEEVLSQIWEIVDKNSSYMSDIDYYTLISDIQSQADDRLAAMDEEGCKE